MTPGAAKLSEEDLVNIAAYTASLKPKVLLQQITCYAEV